MTLAEQDRAIIEKLESIASASEFAVSEFRHDRLKESIDRLVEIRADATIAKQEIETLMRIQPK
jgi:hypothetical protein